MSRLLDQAFDQARQLPEAAQEALGAILLSEMADETRWDELFARPESADLLARLADQALAGAQAGRAKPLDPRDL